MPFTDVENLTNPGERLRVILEDLYPSDLSSGQSCINKMDSALFADGSLASLVYRSTINYLLRRLVSTAVFIKRKCKKNNLPELSVQIEIKRFVNNKLNIHNKNTVEKIATLLVECTEMRDDKPSPGIVKIVKERKESLCYICGRVLDFATVGNVDSAELEHIFPKGMGGSSKADANLKYACFKCNKGKKSYIDDSDYHYEEICFVTDEDDGDKFKNDFEYAFKLAIRAKNEYQCQLCKEPASIKGELHFARRDPEDSWHFLNIETYCAAHILMIQKQRNKNRSLIGG